MPTDNRRVAAYLPKEIDDCFTAFKTERGFGDSQALIVILSEFLGVNQQVAQQGDSLRIGLESRIEALEDRLTHLKNELLSELKGELLRELRNPTNQVEDVEGELSSEPESKLLEDKPTPDQLDLLSEAIEPKGELPSDLASELLKEAELAQRLGCGRSTLGEWRAKGAEFLAEKTKARPGGVAWAFDDATKRYYPLPNAGASNQVNPKAPKGSERSEEG